MVLQDGPSKAQELWREGDAVDLAELASPTPWLLPTARASAEHIMPRPSTCRGRRAGSGRQSCTPRSPGRSRLREVVAADGKAVEDARELVLPPVHAPGAATTCAAQKRVEPIRPLRFAPRRGDHAGPRRHHSQLAKPPAAVFSLAVTRPGLLLRLRQRQGAVSRPAQVRGGFRPQEAQPCPRHSQRAEAPERPMAAPPWEHIHIHVISYHIMHTYIHTHIHTCIHTYMHTCIHTYIHTFIHSYIHSYIRTHMCMYRVMLTYVCMYICMYVYKYIYIYIYIASVIARPVNESSQGS